MRYPKPIALLLAAAMLTACTEPNGEPARGVMNGGALNKQEAGTAIGAVGGGVLGSAIGGGTGNVIAIIGGALLGGYLGNEVGHSLDNADRSAYDHASQRAMENGRREYWRNPHTGHHGSITPTREYTNNAGQECREYTQSIYIDHRRHTAHGTACREADGTWRVVE